MPVHPLSDLMISVGGPDWISLVAGEVKSPRKIMPRAFNSTIYRILFFYVLGAFCVGINTASDDKNLLGAIAAGAPGAAKSPYIICEYSLATRHPILNLNADNNSYEPTQYPCPAFVDQRPDLRLGLLHR